MKHAAPTLAGAVLLAAALTACGGSRPAPAPLSAPKVADRALTALDTVSSVHFTGRLKDANLDDKDYGTGIAVDLTRVRGKGCEGTVSLKKDDVVRVVTIGDDAWFSAGESFWKGTHVPPATADRVAGKWMRTSASTGPFADIMTLCDPEKSLRRGIGDINNVTRYPGGAKSRTVTLVETQKDITLEVTPGRAPRLLSFVSGFDATSTVFTFDRFGARVTLAPPTSNVWNGRTVGV